LSRQTGAGGFPKLGDRREPLEFTAVTGSVCMHEILFVLFVAAAGYVIGYAAVGYVIGSVRANISQS